MTLGNCTPSTFFAPFATTPSASASRKLTPPYPRALSDPSSGVCGANVSTLSLERKRRGGMSSTFSPRRGSAGTESADSVEAGPLWALLGRLVAELECWQCGSSLPGVGGMRNFPSCGLVWRSRKNVECRVSAAFPLPSSLFPFSPFRHSEWSRVPLNTFSDSC